MSAKPRLLQSAIHWILLLLALTLLSSVVAAEQVKNLKPQGYVNDFAGVLSAQAKEKLTALCAEVDQKTKAQIAVVTVSSLEGEPVEQFSIDLGTAWGVGPKQSERGILILVAPNDRKYRVEVGYGLEPILPDGKVGGFGREAVPFFRQSDYSRALLLITERIAGVIASDQGVTLNSLAGLPPPQSQNRPYSPRIPVWIMLLAFFVLFPGFFFLLSLLFGLGSATGSRHGGGPWMGGPWYGGGSSGGGGSWGGGGGGGFGGFGGGSFGGGGASGSW